MTQASSLTWGGETIGVDEVEGCGGRPSNSAPVARPEVGTGAGRRSGRSPGSTALGVNCPAPVMTPRTPASRNTSLARSSGSSASTGT